MRLLFVLFLSLYRMSNFCNDNDFSSVLFHPDVRFTWVIHVINKHRHTLLVVI